MTSKKIMGLPLATCAGLAAINGTYALKWFGGYNWITFVAQIMIWSLYYNIAKCFY